MPREFGPSPEEMGIPSEESKDSIFERGNIRINRENVFDPFQFETSALIVEELAPYMDEKVDIGFKEMKASNVGFNSRLNPEFCDEGYRDKIAMIQTYKDQISLPGYLLHELGHSFEGKLRAVADAEGLEILPDGVHDDEKGFDADFHADLVAAYILEPGAIDQNEKLPLLKNTKTAIEKMFNGQDFSRLREDLNGMITEYKVKQERKYNGARGKGDLTEEEIEKIKPAWLKDGYDPTPFYMRVFSQIEEFARKKTSPEAEQDFTNQDEVRRILESGTEEELKRLQEFHNLSLEQIKLFGYYAKLRRETIKKMQSEIDERKKNNPVASEAELKMGAYNESIEPHIRKTVIALRGKGYNTTLSGFSGLDSQKIKIADNAFDGVRLDDEVVRKLQEKGIEVKIEPNTVSLTCSQEINLKQLEEAWRIIEKEIPDLGHPAEASLLPAAKIFRERQSELGRHL